MAAEQACIRIMDLRTDPMIVQIYAATLPPRKSFLPSRHAHMCHKTDVTAELAWNLEVMSKCFFMSVPST